ncbi:hypothetical protein GOODEAATRI_013044 [Goodea atripinnis]|uniref:m7GpppX diphosphatase n=1 Tax=Goodea atripinnis TaxID=208336 RepID=A0ABV0NJS5_9TELE
MATVAAKREISSAENDELSREAKRAKADDKNGEEGGNESEWENVLSTFTASSVLSDSAREKIMFVHGKIADHDAVVVLEKTPIREDSLAELFRGSKLRLELRNDIYSSYRLQAPPHLNEIKTTVVCPATEKHVKKYKRQESFLVEETGEDYRSITLPYIQEQSLSLQASVLNLPSSLFRFTVGSKSNELISDLKQFSTKTLMVSLIQEAILQRYNLPASKLRVYLHYQPSYYHLHVHFTKLGYDAPGCGVERAHLLSDVIQNLQTDPQFYKSRTLHFPLRADDGLLRRFKEAGRL